MRGHAQSFAKQPFGRVRIPFGRQQKVDPGSRRIERTIQVAPAAFHLDISLITAPRLVGWLQMASHPLLQFRTIPLYPPPYSRMIGLQTTFLQQFSDIAQGKRVAKIPADRTENQLRLGLPPLEDRRPGCHWVLFTLPAAAYGSCNTTSSIVNASCRSLSITFGQSIVALREQCSSRQRYSGRAGRAEA